MPALTPEELWGFDVKGYLHVRGAVGDAELARARSLLGHGAEPHALAEVGAALSSAGEVQRVLSAVLGLKAEAAVPLHPPAHAQAAQHGEVVLDKSWHLLTESDAKFLRGGSGLRRDWHSNSQPGTPFAKGVVVMVAFGGSVTGPTVVPASHKASMPTPAAVLSGDDDLNAYGEPVLVTPSLGIGDLLVLSSEICHGGGSGDLLAAEFVAGGAAASTEVGGAGPVLGWPDTLDPVVRAVLQMEDSPGAGPPPVLLAKQDRTVLADRAQFADHHPAAYELTATEDVDVEELYFFDLNGYLVVRDAASAALIEAANAAIDACYSMVDRPSTQVSGSTKMAGRGRMDLSGLLQLPPPHCNPFLELVVHPAVVKRLLWMEGAGFKANTGLAICSERGCAGQQLHGNPFVSPDRSYAEYSFRNGRVYTGSVNVAWTLHSVTKEDGGFVVVPGSHKAGFDMTTTDSGDVGGHYGVVHPLMSPGDVLFFMGGATAHGAWAVHTDKPRRAALFNYLARGVRYFTRSHASL